MLELEVLLEEWPGSPVVRDVKAGYDRKPAAHFSDAPARLTARQAVFYRNLISLAEGVGGSTLPVDFTIAGRGPVYLDRGCIKIAEHAGFILPLQDGARGCVDTITIAWSV
jgi:hypothetical protein